MHINIFCTKNDQGAWCKDKRIKKSLFGLGPRLCLAFGGKPCPYQKEHKIFKPYPTPPSPPTSRIIKESEDKPRQEKGK